MAKPPVFHPDTGRITDSQDSPFPVPNTGALAPAPPNRINPYGLVSPAVKEQIFHTDDVVASKDDLFEYRYFFGALQPIAPVALIRPDENPLGLLIADARFVGSQVGLQGVMALFLSKDITTSYHNFILTPDSMVGDGEGFVTLGASMQNEVYIPQKYGVYFYSERLTSANSFAFCRYRRTF